MRSARAESRVISTRLGFDAAAAKEKVRKIRLTPATTFRIMTVSVKAAPPLIKTCNAMDWERILADGGRTFSLNLFTQSPVLTPMQLRVQSMYLLLGISSLVVMP